MQSVIINFYSIIDFDFKFCQVNRGISNWIENYSQLPPSVGEGRGYFFLTVSSMVSSQIIFEKLSWSWVPCTHKGVSWFLLSLLVPKTEEDFPPWDLNIIFWKLLINWEYDKFCRTGSPQFFNMPSTVDYRGSKLITDDYYWLFSLYEYPLLQTSVFKADWQYHDSTALTVEYILLILLLPCSVY